MDTNNWRPTPPVGESNLDTGDWRTQLPSDSRERIVNKIMDTLKRHLPFSGQDGLNELKKIAGRFEEKIYTAASSQSDYLRKISLKMLSMESKSQNAMPNSLHSNNTDSSNRPPDPGSMQNQVHNQGQSLPIPLSANQSQARQQLLSQNIQNNVLSAGVQGSSGLSSALRSVSGLSQSPIPSVVGQNVNMQNMPGISQNSGANSQNMQNMTSSNQTGQANGVDWQEEVYQKIKTMKEMYLPELNEMYQKIAAKLQQHDSLPQQPKSDQLEKLKIFKTMLEHIITFLQVAKCNILPGFKEKLGSYEKQIVNFISTNRPRKPVSSLQ